MGWQGSISPQNLPTRKLFQEFHPEGTDSIERWRQVFLECADPTEYAPAIELLGDWREWKRFKRQWPHFNNILAEWHKELEIKLRSNALKEIIKKAKQDVSAAKYLADGRYKLDKPKTILEKEREQEVVQRIHKDNETELGRIFNVIPAERFERKTTSSQRVGTKRS